MKSLFPIGRFSAIFRLFWAEKGLKINVAGTPKHGGYISHNEEGDSLQAFFCIALTYQSAY